MFTTLASPLGFGFADRYHHIVSEKNRFGSSACRSIKIRLVVFKWKALFKCVQFQLNDYGDAEKKIIRLSFVLNKKKKERKKIKQTNKKIR